MISSIQSAQPIIKYKLLAGSGFSTNPVQLIKVQQFSHYQWNRLVLDNAKLQSKAIK
jgi:hypothetical protein